jgi:predicted metal-dependent HD superfamily phosphohydrolase
LIDLAKARDLALSLLHNSLPASLTYHSPYHTIDVVEQALSIAAAENITDPYALSLLESAAWFHDTGFTRTYHEHEAASCDIASELLPQCGATPLDIALINELIMATSLPQKPLSHLGKVLCDADLDYLGRNDFDIHSNNLRNEWLQVGIIKSPDAFDAIQIRFLQKHEYFTSYSRRVRKPAKEAKLAQLADTA